MTLSTTGLILAGGRGARMGGVDKGLQLLRGVPMVRHVMTRLAPQVDMLMINANRHPVVYAGFGVPVWPDQTQDFAGPLAGLQTGLIHCTTQYLISAPCDSPFLPHDLAQALRDALQSKDADLAVAVTGTRDARQLQPVFCLLKTSLLPHLTDYLKNGGRKMETWFGMLNTVQVDFADEAAFRNINTPEDLRKLDATT
jgi:molybdopterin-guanine dinucleotide biosynthesis protein A